MKLASAFSAVALLGAPVWSQSTCKIYNTYTDVEKTNTMEVIFDMKEAEIGDGVEFTLFPHNPPGTPEGGFYDIDIAPSGEGGTITWTLKSNIGASNIVFPTGEFDRYYLNFDVPIASAALVSSDEIVATVAVPQYEDKVLLDAFGTGIGFPEFIDNNFLVLQVRPGTNLTTLEQQIVVDYTTGATEAFTKPAENTVVAWNTFEDATDTMGMEAVYFKAEATIGDELEFSLFPPNPPPATEGGFYDIDVKPNPEDDMKGTITWTLKDNTGGSHILFPPGSFDRYYLEMPFDIDQAIMLGNDMIRSIVRVPFYENTRAMDIMQMGLPFPPTIGPNVIVMEVVPGANLDPLDQKIEVEYTKQKAQTEICQAPCEVDDKGNKTCKFTVIVDIYASRHGYMSFAECGPQTNPTLGLELGATYIFEQTDVSNYMNPITFSYMPDGGHRGGPLVAADVVPSGSSSDCADSMSCPAPMYFTKGGYLGRYSNIEELAPLMGCGDNGLSQYSTAFSNSLRDWVLTGGWQVALKLDVDDMVGDLFYHNDILPFMSGRMKVLNSDGTPVQEEDLPELGFEYQVPSDFDAKCGTIQIDGNSLPHPMCPKDVVCDVPEDNQVLKDFAECVEAIDCQMIQGMTNTVKHNNPLALFMHQMIPHHQAAGNMAKAIMKTGLVDCPDITDNNNPHCMLERMLRETFTKQHDDVIKMRTILGGLGLPGEREDRCKIENNFGSAEPPKPFSVFFP